MINPNYIQHKLTGSQINTLVMKNDLLNSVLAIQEQVYELEYGEVRDKLEIGIGNAIDEVTGQIRAILP